jgi:hypothetical protein
VKAGGRCQLKHCNKPVYQHGMTLADGNFADVAHIIGASKVGPRGNADSENLQVDPANLMLLCKDCHKLIDTYEEKYGADLLRQWKREHEERIEILTSISPQIPRSTILRFQVNIGKRIIGIADEAMYNAMFDQDPPKYPVDKKGISIVETKFDLYGEEAYWEKFAQDRIANKLRFHLDTGIEDQPIRHLSIFGIGPMPLLMYLGKCIGDTIQADIYHANRNISDTNKTWSWNKKSSGNLDSFKSQTIVDCPTSKNIALILEISDQLALDKYADFQQEEFAIYKISVDQPSIHFIESSSQIEAFSRVFRQLLNYIQAVHGVDGHVFLLPAIPASIAIECGRVLLPTKDPHIYVCQMQKNRKFKRVLQLL